MTCSRLRGLTVASCLLLALVLAGCTESPKRESDAERTDDPGTLTATGPGSTDGATSAASTDAPTSDGETSPRPAGAVRVTGTVAHDLEAPWGLAFLPDGSALVTERDSGTVSRVRDGTVTPIGSVPETTPTGEGGLLGVAVSPTFARDSLVYLYVTTGEDNRVLATTYDGSRLGDLRPILTGIPAGSIHDGGRLAIGPDGYLYVSTGETGQDELAQERDSLGGKVLRITRDGDPAPGNPDRSPVWTLGHRNVQGLAFDDADRLWATEFGSDVWDELNRIQRGNNYGWPAAEGDSDLRGYTDPLVQWRPEDASPSGLAYADGALWVASLRGSRLWEVPVRDDGGLGQPVAHFVGEYGRLRTVVAAPDGSLWLTTSNRDGRGDPAPEDDRILQVAIR